MKRACLAVGVLVLSAVLLGGTGESRHFQLPFNMRAAAAAVAATAVISGTPLNADAIISDGPTTYIAARSGGRVGGRAPAPRAAPRAAPSVRSNTNIYIAPTPSYGYGGYGYGGYGYRGPSFGPFGFSTGSFALDAGIGVAELLVREQQRQAFLQNQIKVQRELGKDAATIDQLQREVEAGNARLKELEQQVAAGKQAPAPAQAAAPAPAQALAPAP